MKSDTAMAGQVRRITRTDRQETVEAVGYPPQRITLKFFDITCLIDGHPTYFSLDKGTAFYLKNGDYVEAAGRLVDGTFVVFAMRNLTDGSLYSWKTIEGYYRRLSDRVLRIIGWIMACLATPAIIDYAIQVWPVSHWQSLYAVGGGALTMWCVYKLIFLISKKFSLGPLAPGNAETESSAQQLLGVTVEEAHRIIWV